MDQVDIDHWYSLFEKVHSDPWHAHQVLEAEEETPTGQAQALPLSDPMLLDGALPHRMLVSDALTGSRRADIGAAARRQHTCVEEVPVLMDILPDAL